MYVIISNNCNNLVAISYAYKYMCTTLRLEKIRKLRRLHQSFIFVRIWPFKVKKRQHELQRNRTHFRPIVNLVPCVLWPVVYHCNDSALQGMCTSRVTLVNNEQNRCLHVGYDQFSLHGAPLRWFNFLRRNPKSNSCAHQCLLKTPYYMSRSALFTVRVRRY